jgi:hypothetical protein
MALQLLGCITCRQIARQNVFIKLICLTFFLFFIVLIKNNILTIEMILKLIKHLNVACNLHTVNDFAKIPETLNYPNSLCAVETLLLRK